MRESEVIDRIINAMDEAEAAIGMRDFQSAEHWVQVADKWAAFFKDIDFAQEGDEEEEVEEAEEEDDDDYEDLEALWDAADPEEVVHSANGHGAAVDVVAGDEDEEDDGLGDDPDDIRRLGPIEPLP